MPNLGCNVSVKVHVILLHAWMGLIETCARVTVNNSFGKGQNTILCICIFL